MKRKINPASEEVIQRQLVEYIRMQYKDVILIVNPQASVKMTIGQAKKMKLLGYQPGQPDLILIKKKVTRHKSMFHPGYYETIRNGLAIELKKDGEPLFKVRRKMIKSIWGCKPEIRDRKIRPFKSDHLINQYNYLMKLKSEGYKVSFAIGFDKAKNIIDKYMRG